MQGSLAGDCACVCVRAHARVYKNSVWRRGCIEIGTFLNMSQILKPPLLNCVHVPLHSSAGKV